MENGAYTETLHWFVQNQRLNQNVHAGRNLRPSPQELHDESSIVGECTEVVVFGTVSSLQFSTVTQNVAYFSYAF